MSYLKFAFSCCRVEKEAGVYAVCLSTGRILYSCSEAYYVSFGEHPSPPLYIPSQSQV